MRRESRTVSNDRPTATGRFVRRHLSSSNPPRQISQEKAEPL
jgi:hypothetical protein